MKGFIRHYAIDTFSLYLASLAARGLVFEKGLETLLLTGLGLALVSILAKPIINILLLPINLVTFGLFKWVSAAIAIYLVTLIIPGFKVSTFFFPGLTTKWFELPSISLPGFFSYIGFSFLLSVASSTLYWLSKN